MFWSFVHEYILIYLLYFISGCKTVAC